MNRAAIFFDFNAPIITNETWHTVDTGFLERNIFVNQENMIEKNNIIRLSPNPSEAGGIIFLEKIPNGAHWFCMTNVLGERVFQGEIMGNTVRLPENLAAGAYWFVVKDGRGEVLGVGKMAAF